MSDAQIGRKFPMSQDDPFADRRKLTFEQAEGAAPLPRQLRTKEVSSELAALLWACVHESIQSDVIYEGVAVISGHWWRALRDFHVLHEHQPVDQFEETAERQIDEVRQIIYSKDYLKVFGFLQFVLRVRHTPLPSSEINEVLSICRAAYRVLDGDAIVPIGSDAERETLERAFADLASAEFHGTRAHLRKAGAALTDGDFPASIRESIHSVESVARVLWQAKSLKEAMEKAKRSVAIHPAMEKGFLALYDYTSDEKGIRHSLLEGTAKVDEADALFMIGACASFVSYMIGKARSVGVLDKKK